MKNKAPIIPKLLSRLLLFVLFITTGSAAFAQSGTISTTFLSLPDTAVLGDTGTAVVVVKNMDSAPYAGYINIYYSTDTVAFTPVQFCSLNNISLNPGDSVATTCTITFDSTYFTAGSNIVVVWSSGNGKFAADTLRDSLYLISQTAGIYENSLNASFTIFPSPAKDLVAIKIHNSALPKDLLQSIKIVDIFGRPVQTELFVSESKKVSVRNLPPGLYFLELQFTTRQRAVQKFVRSD